MNPTITVSPSSDTGILIAGHEIGKMTGVGIIGGAIAGAMVGGKKHRLLGTAIGLVGGFFAGRWEDDRIAKQAQDATVKVMGGNVTPA